MKNVIKPVAYFRATKRHGIIWGEDCCCYDPVYDLDDDYDEQTVFSLPVYSSDVIEALKNRIFELEEINGLLQTQVHSLEMVLTANKSEKS